MTVFIRADRTAVDAAACVWTGAPATARAVANRKAEFYHEGRTRSTEGHGEGKNGASRKAFLAAAFMSTGHRHHVTLFSRGKGIILEAPTMLASAVGLAERPTAASPWPLVVLVFLRVETLPALSVTRVDGAPASVAGRRQGGRTWGAGGRRSNTRKRAGRATAAPHAVPPDLEPSAGRTLSRDPPWTISAPSGGHGCTWRRAGSAPSAAAARSFRLRSAGGRRGCCRGRPCGR